MRIFLLYFILFLSFIIADDQPPVFLPIESAEDFYSGSSISLEVQVTDESLIKDILLYYRFSKDDSYTSISMEKDIFHVGEIPESEVRPGRLEFYYFARDEYGNQSTWPENGENSPESYPVFEPLSSGGSNGNISIELLNPIEDEVSEDASIIILSLYDPEESLDIDDIRLFVNDKDVSESTFKSTDMITYVPNKSLESGKHVIEVKFVDDGGVYFIKKFKFTLAELDLSLAERVNYREKFKFKGNISYNSDFDEFFGKDRPENRPFDSHKLNISAKFTIGDIKVKSSILMNTHLIDETARLALDRSQPSNRFKFGLSSRFLDFKYGDFSTEFSEFTVKGTRVRGVYSRIKIGPWKTSIISGNTKEKIEFENEIGYDPGYGVWSSEEAEVYFDEPNGSYESTIDECNPGIECNDDSPLEDFIDNGNGQYDEGEEYIDSNDNGQWDDEEILNDSNDNGQWDDEEILYDNFLNQSDCEASELSLTWDQEQAICFIDNGNGQYDEGEEYIDSNDNSLNQSDCEASELSLTWNQEQSICFMDQGNGIWDSAETFTDNPSSVDGTSVSGFELISHVKHTKGTSARKMDAIRTELDFSKFNFGINALRSYDDYDSLNYDELYDQYTFLGNAVIGMDFTLRLNNKKTQLKGETAISLMNDLRGTSIEVLGEKLDMAPDEIDSNKDLLMAIEDLVGFSINSDLIIGGSEGRGISIPLPDMDSLDIKDYVLNSVFKQGTYRFLFKTPIEFEENSFDVQAEYRRVPTNFISLGNSSIQTDIQGFKSSLKGRLFKNILSVSLGYDNEHDNLMGETPEEKLKSSTSTSITTSGGFGINYIDYPSVNYSIRVMNREGVSVQEQDIVTSNKTITHTISPSYKFDTKNDINVSLGGNIMMMDYNDNLYAPSDETATNTNFTTGSYTGSVGLRFDSPLSVNIGGGLSINSPEDIDSKPTEFLVVTSKLGYKFMEKKLSTFLGLNIVSGSKVTDSDGNGGIDNLKMTIKAGAQYKLTNSMSVGMNINFISLSDNITPANDFSELKGKLKFKMSF
jgi:opacity protein-like surface antigen